MTKDKDKWKGDETFYNTIIYGIVQLQEPISFSGLIHIQTVKKLKMF